jgi:hypothetical protein
LFTFKSSTNSSFIIYSVKGFAWLRHWTAEFIKQVFPRFYNPTCPFKSEKRVSSVRLPISITRISFSGSKQRFFWVINENILAGGSLTWLSIKSVQKDKVYERHWSYTGVIGFVMRNLFWWSWRLWQFSKTFPLPWK